MSAAGIFFKIVKWNSPKSPKNSIENIFLAIDLLHIILKRIFMSKKGTCNNVFLGSYI